MGTFSYLSLLPNRYSYDIFSPMKKHTILTPFLLAVGMLTTIPVNSGKVESSDWKWCAAWFPACGVILGTVCMLPWALLLVLKAFALQRSWTYFDIPGYSINLIGSFLFVAGLAWMTRIFHLDGFCDTCDAFSAVTNDPAKRLEIMKDPHPGAAAVFASCLLMVGKIIVVFLLLQKISLSLEIREALYRGIPVLILIPVAARFAMLLLAKIGNYARANGTGATVINSTSAISVIIGVITLIPYCIFIKPVAMAVLIFGMIFLAVYWKNKATPLLGGITGDILGACCETGEVIAGFLLLIMI
jgi:adenosylcobinamide-GDP ribazoletransferase